ncbi:MAG: DciA family protein [Tepidisphaeraceae bacterium]|jgi:hypothetical protein
MPAERSSTLEDLRRLQRCKTQAASSLVPLGQQMIDFFKQSVAKRQTRLVRIAECWGRLVPQFLSDHCALESLHRGTLMVLVDSSSHLYELKQLLLAGLDQQLLLACKSTGLRKISLKAGRWYDGDHPDDRRLKFPAR